MRAIDGRQARRQDGFSMIEMLVTIIVMGIVSTMVLGVWFALQSSYAFSISADNSRGVARDSMARMELEIRDAAAQPDQLSVNVPSGYPYVDSAINAASGSQINFTTPFNDPSLVIEDVAYKYVVNADGKAGTLYRYKGSNPSCVDPTTDPDAIKSTLATNVVNYTAGNNVPIFTYTSYTAAGGYATSNSVSGTSALQDIVTVQIHLLIDTTPGHSPVYMDLMSTVEPRNMRHN
jgi:prepilin-type N-terminal cleavage/methylation domain-containing protein